MDFTSRIKFDHYHHTALHTQGTPKRERFYSELGFTQWNQVKLRGDVFELFGAPIVMTDNSRPLCASKKKSRQLKRVRIPHPIVNMANGGIMPREQQQARLPICSDIFPIE
jgi:hypothetical protein